MRNHIRLIRAAVLVPAVLITLVATGCAHYKVIDPASGKAYYTTDIDRDRRGSAISFKDAKTNAEITLTSSEVHKISGKEFDDAVKGP